MSTISDETKEKIVAVTTAIGREAIAARMGVGVPAVYLNERRGLPASWYIAIRRMGAERGIHVPRCLFRWKGLGDE